MIEVFLVALRLGLTSFGGPIAHLGYFRREYVERRGWVDEQTYADLVGLCQSVPGPTSSEVGISIGLLRAGPLGAFLAWLGFTLPSALLMVAFAYVGRVPAELGWLFPLLKFVAFGVVAYAVWGMAHALAWDVRRGTMALVSAAIVLAFPAPAVQIGVIAAAAFVGLLLLHAPVIEARAPVAVPFGQRTAIAALAIYLGLLFVLPVVRTQSDSLDLAVFDSFYRASALVFGGGHVVLPLLQAEVVPRGWTSLDQFVAGYGAAQLVPGPLNTFASYLGVVIDGPRGAIVATVAIFLPAFLLVAAALPSWGVLRTRPSAQRALRGVNAAVVGLLLSALVTIGRAIASGLI
ncbi:MAG TPA: chromate efflux transporter [Candidatus Acidoferrales bacterium]|nr:chromate efflux transporter [Candidatus Acidoferrales bacterium]